MSLKAGGQMDKSKKNEITKCKISNNPRKAL